MRNGHIRAAKNLFNAFALPEQLTLNQRVQGSSPCAPTIDLTWLFSPLHWNIADQLGGQLGVFVRFSSLRIALSPSAGSRFR